MDTGEMQQLRLQQEQVCRKLADELKAKMPPNSGFVLFLCDYGPAGTGSMSYVATVARDDARRLTIEWLHKTGGLAEAIAAYLDEQIANARAGVAEPPRSGS